MNIIKLLICIAICLFVGGLGGFATSGEVTTWYLTIQKPTWNPPSWVFGPVWTMLYVLMGVALYWVWQAENVSKQDKQNAITIFIIQLIFNCLWSFIFFKWHAIGWALVEIILLWSAIIATIFFFHKVKKLAAWILLPYLAWVSFATFLNFTIWSLN